MRIFDIIKTQFALDKLRIEEEIERTFNRKDLGVGSQAFKLKQLIIEAATTELAFKKFESYIKDDNKNKED